MNFISKLDATFAVTRPLWGWIGQVALVILGTHLAADRLDDDLGRLFGQIPVQWSDPQIPFELGTWGAIGIELAVAVWAILALARTAESRVSGPREWVGRLSLHNLTGPLFWLPVSLAGSWAIAMAVEDLLPPGPIATYTAMTVGILVALRLAGTGLWQLVIAAPTPKRRSDGWFWVVPLGTVAGYAAWYGLPVWGWLA